MKKDRSMVQLYVKAPVERPGKDGGETVTVWRDVGVMWIHFNKDGDVIRAGISLDCLPLEGQLQAFPPREREKEGEVAA